MARGHWGARGSGPNDVYAVGESGLILHYDGGSWAPMNSGITLKLEGVWGSSATGVYAVGIAGTVLHRPRSRVQQYTLTVTPNGRGNIDPNGGAYDADWPVALTATAAVGWRFVEWRGGLTGTTNPARLVMDGNKSVTAVFAAESSGGTPCAVQGLLALSLAGLMVLMLGLRRRPTAGTAARKDKSGR